MRIKRWSTAAVDACSNRTLADFYASADKRYPFKAFCSTDGAIIRAKNIDQLKFRARAHQESHS